jgi:hypothetical protein
MTDKTDSRRELDRSHGEHERIASMNDHDILVALYTKFDDRCQLIDERCDGFKANIKSLWVTVSSVLLLLIGAVIEHVMGKGVR